MGSLKQEIYGHMAQEHQRLKEANEEIKVLKAKAKWMEAEGAKGFTMKEHIGTQTDHTSSSSGGRNLTTQPPAPFQFGPWASGYTFPPDTDRGPPTGTLPTQGKITATEEVQQDADTIENWSLWTTRGLVCFMSPGEEPVWFSWLEYMADFCETWKEWTAICQEHGQPGDDDDPPGEALGRVVSKEVQRREWQGELSSRMILRGSR